MFHCRSPRQIRLMALRHEAVFCATLAVLCSVIPVAVAQNEVGARALEPARQACAQGQSLRAAQLYQQFADADKRNSSTANSERLHRQAQALVCATPLTLVVQAGEWSKSLTVAARNTLTQLGLRITSESTGQAVLELELAVPPPSASPLGFQVVRVQLLATLRDGASSAALVSATAEAKGGGHNIEAATNDATQTLIQKEVTPVLKKLLAALVGVPLSCESEAAYADAELRECRPVLTGQRLIQHSGELFVEGPTVGLRRGSLLYAMSSNVVGAAQHRVRLGLLIGVSRENPELLRVAWYCRFNDAPIPAQGLPVEVVPDDTRPRVGRCLGTYNIDRPEDCDHKGSVDLRIQLGSGEGVQPYDLFEVLGAPIVDSENRTVLDFVPMGRCTVLPGHIAPLSAVCRYDRLINSKTGYTPEKCRRGGYVRFIPR